MKSSQLAWAGQLEKAIAEIRGTSYESDSVALPTLCPADMTIRLVPERPRLTRHINDVLEIQTLDSQAVEPVRAVEEG